MPMSTRRRFLQQSTTAALVGLALPHPAMATAIAPARYYLSLRAGNLGVQADLPTTIDLAIKHGFKAVSPNPAELVELSDSHKEAITDKMKAQQLRWGAAGLPVEFRQDGARFKQDLGALPAMAAAMEEMGITRVGTWIMPTHADLTYRQNFQQHAARLRAIGQVLGTHGIRLGLEYVGPKTLWASKRHTFVHSMAETLELIDAIGLDNLGLVLDSFHWYTAHETAADILTLTNEQVVAVDLNDARKGFERDEQIDGKRELPSATGVIELEKFMRALLAIGYDGPLRAEPFNQPLRDMEDEQAVQTTYKAMKKTMDLVKG